MIGSDEFYFNLKRDIRGFCADDNGSTAIEYAMVAVGIAVAVVGAVSNLGSTVKTSLFEKIASVMP